METVLENASWTKIIRPKRSFFSFDFKELWRYRDLLMLFVKRDFISVYKQTILGPLWFVLQPILTTLIFVLVFGRIAKLPVGETPMMLFYLAGNVAWSYFADCFLKTSNTFVSNAGLFGKVYFPRLIIPLSIVISSLFKFGIQLVMFLFFWIYYYASGAPVQINTFILLLPVLVIIIAGYGLGFGIILSSLTTRYRDLRFLIGFGIQLWMFASPVIFPYSSVTGQLRSILWFNPMTHIIEIFKYSFFSEGYVSLAGFIYTFLLMLVMLVMGILLFNRVEKNFMDTV